ncbi:MAG TPA: four helix bundle protein [Pyrinomonadaceae bacterium]
MVVKRFEDLQCWQMARTLNKKIYRLTSDGRFARDFALRDQIRKASISILSNIAEGFERGGDKEFLQFLAIAKGSSGEVRAQLYVALDQQYIAEDACKLLRDSVEEIGRLLSGLMKYLRTSQLKGNKYK